MSARSFQDEALVERVRVVLDALRLGGTRVAVGLSGGVDSVVLLHLLAELAPAVAIDLSAIHVHHGLSPRADDWTEHCVRLCASLGVPLTVEHVRVARSDRRGVEAAARAARYRCYDALRVDAVALAHHLDDQAETVLLQLLRGAGVSGLAAMPLERSLASGIRLVRPLIGIRRTAIEAHARVAGLQWVRDESNDDVRYLRNFVRRDLLPLLATRFPGYRETLGRAARNAADARHLADRLADMDLESCAVDDGLSIPSIHRLDLVRQVNVMRAWLARHGVTSPSREALLAGLQQLRDASPDGQPVLEAGCHRVVRHRDRIVIRERSAASLPWQFAWHGEGIVSLPDGREVHFDAVIGEGLGAAALAGGAVTLSTRQGGERMAVAPDRPRRTLKNLFQEAGMPPWERSRMVLVFVGDRLVHVVGLATDPAFACAPGEPGYRLRVAGPHG
ncbi:MAG: tRNA lysidine(34) synthetase TilS [Betaproteobacteria bacterium]|nr:tRNA lysidine(34) synthetase TilS [Betaproteobacteria bacterium]